MTDDSRSGSEAPEQTGATSRRRLLVLTSVGLGGITAIAAVVPFAAFVASPLLRRPEQQWRSVGSVSQFRVGETVKVSYLDPEPLPWAGFAAESAVWLSRGGDNEFRALSAYCTHTGCPVRWVAGAQLFLCPCHGGVFHRDGTVAAGPPPRPLPPHEVRVRDGEVELLTRPVHAAL